MKTMADIEDRLRMELNQWFKKQCEDIYSDFYLYYLPTTKEHIGEFIIAKQKPTNPEYKLLPGRINKGATVQQNMNLLRDTMRKLPILEY